MLTGEPKQRLEGSHGSTAPVEPEDKLVEVVGQMFPELETWVAYVSGSPAGYFELEGQGDGNVEIACFAVAPGIRRQGGGRRVAHGRDHAGLGHGSDPGLGSHL